ncbi:hypothetical protein MAIT1_00448 [Magnetofaba australis IT-1]|uniref:Uncharacterized protein n=1 Tax=Magnetofaba australis IT-1 TaxID=1434232 RepID=A0A1Y2JYS1_9PROT|nr:hypothetical protein MAIT1_00448 [Magnetofaba australis IT-1]
MQMRANLRPPRLQQGAQGFVSSGLRSDGTIHHVAGSDAVRVTQGLQSVGVGQMGDIGGGAGEGGVPVEGLFGVHHNGQTRRSGGVGRDGLHIGVPTERIKIRHKKRPQTKRRRESPVRWKSIASQNQNCTERPMFA